MTMAAIGQPSVCFSCGQPLPANVAEGGGGGNAPMFPLTGGMPAQPAPPPNPYVGIAQAILSGGIGDFTIPTGAEIKDVIEAPTEEEAQATIRQMGYFVTKITAKKARKKTEATGGKKKRGFVFGGVKSKDLTTFTRQLSFEGLALNVPRVSQAVCISFM